MEPIDESQTPKVHGNEKPELVLEQGDPTFECPSQINKILERVGDVAALPQVVCQVVQATENEDASVIALERTILIDPGLSTRILAQANSAYYALPRKVTSIREAVMFLGFRGVRQLAMTVGVFDLFLGKTDRDSLRRRSWWRHSLDSALACRTLAEFLPLVAADEAYTCGLLHLIGKTLLDRYDAAQYERVQNVVDQGAPDVLAERAVFQCDHIEVALGVARKWGFPEILVNGLNYFTPVHEPTAENALRACTALGSRLTRLIRANKPAEEIGSELLPGWILDVLEVTDIKVKAVAKSVADSLESASMMGL